MEISSQILENAAEAIKPILRTGTLYIIAPQLHGYMLHSGAGNRYSKHEKIGIQDVGGGNAYLYLGSIAALEARGLPFTFPIHRTEQVFALYDLENGGESPFNPDGTIHTLPNKAYVLSAPACLSQIDKIKPYIAEVSV